MTKKILIVDDDERLLAGLRRSLRSDFDLVTALNSTQALEQVEKNGPFAVIVSDNMMPGMQGIELLGKLIELAPDTIRIMLTGTTDMEIATRAINEGGIFKLLIKPCPAEKMKEVLNAAIAEYDLGFERRRIEAELTTLAFTDELTGIDNRRRFFELAEAEFERAQRFKRPLAALMLDIDFFKAVNDTHGHAVGDIALKMVAKTIHGGLRRDDIFGRYGGEEFAVLLVETDHEKALQAAERLRKSISEHEISTDQISFKLTISIGGAVLKKSDILLSDLLTHADTALYLAKENGRNRVEFRVGPENKAEASAQ